VYLTKKLNQRRPNNMDETMRQTQLVKIDTESLHKIGEDPLARFLDMIKKISYIANSQTALKSNFKKFLVDLFYNKVIMGQDYKPA
jgi:ethanolamine utilization cobalamin adenosyltransferase